MSNFSCRQVPTLENLQSILADLSRHEFLVKPLGALYALNGGIPLGHKPFWKEVTIDCLLCLYNAMHVTPRRVLKVIIGMTSSQARVFGYLIQFVGNMKIDQVRRFLRFVMEGSALVVDKITIEFNSLAGMNHRPIVHTCASLLQLPTCYTSLEFCEDFATPVQ